LNQNRSFANCINLLSLRGPVVRADSSARTGTAHIRTGRKSRDPAPAWNYCRNPGLSQKPYSREYSMKFAGLIMAASAALSIAGTSALAQQTRTGMVTRIDRISGTISVRDMPDGTTGAKAGAATEEFKVQDGARLNALHAGDRVTFAVSETAGTKTITKIDKTDAVTKIDKK
jgi:Cu/Ag efflux protein CusF